MIIPSLPFTLRQLEVFATLARTGSFRTSAEELGALRYGGHMGQVFGRAHVARSLYVRVF